MQSSEELSRVSIKDVVVAAQEFRWEWDGEV